MRSLLPVLFMLSTCIAQQGPKPAVLPNGEGTRYDLKFGTAIMKVTSEQTGGKWSMVDFTANPGMQTMLHLHRKTDETFFVIEGDLTMSLQGKILHLHPGDIALVPKMTPHAFANLTDKPVRFLGTFTPTGFEKFFVLTADAAAKHAPGTPEFDSAMDGIMKKVDMEMLGPPPFGQPGSAAH
jgi:mannose-6-phosphate isomerase-like protein (cupin superfamily)